MKLTRRWILSSVNKSYIWPRSAALPCEWSTVSDADGFLMYTATTSFPLFVFSLNTSPFSLLVSTPPVILSFSFTPPQPPPPPPPSSSTTSYDGGLGGKNANFAAIDDVIAPIIYNPTTFKFSKNIYICIFIAEFKSDPDGVLVVKTEIQIQFKENVWEFDSIFEGSLYLVSFSRVWRNWV